MAAKAVVRYIDVARCVQPKLKDGPRRVDVSPKPFKFAFWPDRSALVQMLPEYQPSPTENSDLNDEFEEEVRAIVESLNSLGHEPSFAKWQKDKTLYRQSNQRVVALDVCPHGYVL